MRRSAISTRVEQLLHPLTLEGKTLEADLSALSTYHHGLSAEGCFGGSGVSRKLEAGVARWRFLGLPGIESGGFWVTDRENPDIGIGIKGPTNAATPSSLCVDDTLLLHAQ